MKYVTPRDAARQVLQEAAEAPHFVAFSDAERLIWMLERAFELGMQTATDQDGRTPTSRVQRVLEN